VLAAAVRLEPTTLALRPLREIFGAPYLPNRMFNAEFATLDDQGIPRPYLVEALPQLNTDTWKVSPDGRMETTYRLLPNLTWQDGAPFSAEDFVFGYRVYTTPELGLLRTPPFDTIDEVLATDDRTLVIRWKRPYPDANHMAGRDRQFPALPRHLLEQTYQTESADTFSSLPYWTREYVGLGPFRVVRWEPGAFIEAEAFTGHARGRAKIDRIRLSFIPDVNTVLANALAGEVQLVGDNAVQFEQAATLRREWEPRGGGTVLAHYNTWRGVNFQFRPAFVRPEALLDVRVRQALAHGVDRQALNEAIYGGTGYLIDFLVPPVGQWGVAAQRGAATYGYDVRRTEQLMREAGFQKGPDGFYAGAAGRFSAELKSTAGPDNEKELAATVDAWRSAGFDVTQAIVPNALAQDLETRAAYPSMYLLSTPAGERAAASFTPENIPLPENRWRGGNRSGWSNPTFTRLAEQFVTTLEVEPRKEQLTQMARLFTEDVAAISLYARAGFWAHTSALSGMTNVPSDSNVAWNIETWELR
jgi:peptide/nickel transport system substrate-binding protein